MVWRLVLVGLVVVSCLGFPEAPACAEKQDQPTLHVLNWKNYFPFDPDIPEEKGIYARSKVLQEFAARHGCRIEVDEVVNEIELRDRLLTMQGYYDVVVYSACDVQYLHKAGLLRSIPREQLAHLPQVAKAHLKVNSALNGLYFVPYLSGTTGIIYRRDLLDHPPVSWEDYFEPKASLQGRIGALDSAYSMFLCAFEHLGFGKLREDPSLLQQAADLLRGMERRQMWEVITSDHVYLEKLLGQGQIWMTIGYSGAAARMQRKWGAERIGYALPTEGAEIWGDGFIIPRGVRHPQLAYAFIDYMISPEVQYEAARNLLYIPANARAAEKISGGGLLPSGDPLLHIPPGMYPVLNRADITSSRMEGMWRDIVSKHHSHPPGQ